MDEQVGRRRRRRRWLIAATVVAVALVTPVLVLAAVLSAWTPAEVFDRDPVETDERVVAATSAAEVRLRGHPLATRLAAAFGGTLGEPAVATRCTRGQQNWKVKDPFDLECHTEVQWVLRGAVSGATTAGLPGVQVDSVWSGSGARWSTDGTRYEGIDLDPDANPGTIAWALAPDDAFARPSGCSALISPAAVPAGGGSVALCVTSFYDADR
jgi:hypothetical protein